MQDHTRFAARSIFLAACVLAATGFSRPPSKTLEPPRGFEISVREVNVETGYDARTGAPKSIESRTTLCHVGRIESSRGGKNGEKSGRTPDQEVTVYTDSLLFRSDAPFRFVAALSRDTVQVASADNKPAAQMGGIESDEEMLRCLFEGPSLRVRPPSADHPTVPVMEHLKSECQGGLYRRLNLPATMGAFVFAHDHEADDRSKKSWRSIVTPPGFSGLGLFPQLWWTYRVIEDRGGDSAATIEIACDTTLTGMRSALANGDTVDIIADRIQVKGTVKSWRGVPLFHEGKIEIREEVRYVRPALDTAVLEKRCDAVITLSPR